MLGQIVYILLNIFWVITLAWFMFIMVMMMRLFFNAMRQFQFYEYTKNKRRMTLVGLGTMLSVFLILAFVYENTVVGLISHQNAHFNIKEDDVMTRPI